MRKKSFFDVSYNSSYFVWRRGLKMAFTTQLVLHLFESAKKSFLCFYLNKLFNKTLWINQSLKIQSIRLLLKCCMTSTIVKHQQISTTRFWFTLSHYERTKVIGLCCNILQSHDLLLNPVYQSLIMTNCSIHSLTASSLVLTTIKDKDLIQCNYLIISAFQNNCCSHIKKNTILDTSRIVLSYV